MSDLIDLNNSELLRKEINFIPYLYKVLLTKDKSVHYFNNWFSTLEIFAYEFGLSDLIPYYSNNLNKINDSNYDDKVYFLRLWINETTDNNIKNLYENANNIDDQINLIFRYFADQIKNTDNQQIKIYYPTKFRINEYNKNNLIKFYLNYYRFKETEFKLGIDLDRTNCFNLIFKRNYQYSFSYFSIYHNYIFEFNNSEIEFINEFNNFNKLNSINELSKIKEFINNLDDNKINSIDFNLKLKELNEIKKLICNKIRNLKSLENKSLFKYGDQNNNSKNYETDELSRDDETDELSRYDETDELSRDDETFTDNGYLLSNDESSKESSKEDNYDNLKQLNKSTNINSICSIYNLINEFINQDCLMFNHSVKINLDDDQLDLNNQLIKQLTNQQFLSQSINSKIYDFTLQDQYEEKQFNSQFKQSSLMCLQSNQQQSNELKSNKNLSSQQSNQKQSNQQHQYVQQNLKQLERQENIIKSSKEILKSKEQHLNQLNDQNTDKYKLPSNLAKKYQQNLCQFSQQIISPKLPTNLVKLSKNPKQNLDQLSQQSSSKYKLPPKLAKKYQENQFNQQISLEQSFSKKLNQIQNSIKNLKLFNNRKSHVEIKQLYPLIDETKDPNKQIIKQLKPNLNLVHPKIIVESSSFDSKIKKSNYKESGLI